MDFRLGFLRRSAGTDGNPEPAEQREEIHETPSSRSLEVRASALTHVGRVRSENQDAVNVTRPTAPEPFAKYGVLAMVADGMGGHAGGEIASTIACRALPNIYFSSSEPPQMALQNAVLAANAEIYAMAQTRPELQGMGTTCVALAVVADMAWMTYVGDSRLYLRRDAKLYRLTEDHSVVYEMVTQGLLSREEARNHRDRNVLSRALGSKSEVRTSGWETAFRVFSNDRFLLCSDGLHDLLDDNELLEMMATPEIDRTTAHMIEVANERGGYDNISAVLVEIFDNSGGPRTPPNPTREVTLA